MNDVPSTYDSLGQRARGYAGDASRWGERHLPGGARTLWVGFALVVIVALLWLLRPAATPQQGGRFGMGGPMPVGVAKIASGDINVTFDALGTATSLATVTVRPQVSGTILKIDFQEGAMVKAGDVLAEIDPRTYIDALNQAKGQLARDQAALNDAMVELKRYQNLVAQGALSLQQRDTQLAQVHQDQGTIEADKATVQAAAVNLGFTKVISPITGRAGIRQVDVGNLVQAGQASQIVVVTQLDPISVLFSLPEDDLGQIMRQLNQGGQLQVEAYDRSQTRLLATGTLSAVDSQIDPTTGTVKMRAMFDNKDGALFPDQFVNVVLRVEVLHDQTVAPAAAIQRGAQGSFVYAVNRDSTVSMRSVSTGVTDGDKIQILQGLRPGEVVVVDGADRLTDGSEVVLPKGQHGTGTAGSSAGSPAGGHHGGFMKIFRKLTADERDQLRGMSHDARRAWIKAHMAELLKRPDQPSSGGGGPP
ncbi:MAG: efflux RND transporter periplasmic adaptor subunit [Alphaproteobacteria bacterium]|nr:efflux RND transporter periplasmic adaptor subunit [Alphaproteobacteria bacterium]